MLLYFHSARCQFTRGSFVFLKTLCSLVKIDSFGKNVPDVRNTRAVQIKIYGEFTNVTALSKDVRSQRLRRLEKRYQPFTFATRYLYTVHTETVKEFYNSEIARCHCKSS